MYRGADKSSARPEWNKLQRQKSFIFIYPVYNHDWRNISTIYIYIYKKTSIKRNILTIKKIHREEGQVKDLSAPPYSKSSYEYRKFCIYLGSPWELLFSFHCYFLIIRHIFLIFYLDLFFVTYFCFLCCIYCVFVLFCILFPFLCSIFFLFLYKTTYWPLPPGANSISVNNYHHNRHQLNVNSIFDVILTVHRR